MKVHRFSHFQGQIPFSISYDNRDQYLDSFLESDLGLIYVGIPWIELIRGFNLKESNKGPQSIFSPRGKLALMFLKHYAGVSDKKLIAQLNGNIDYQIFCDIIIEPTNRIKNYKIVSEIRCELADKFELTKIQEILANAWRPYCENKNSITCDATCYESYLRYPTDVKLLFETVTWNHKQLRTIKKYKKQRMIRSKFNKWIRRYKGYSKSRRPSRKATRSVTGGLLRLLRKLHKELITCDIQGVKNLPAKYLERRITTGLILDQQWQKYFDGIKPINRIVSLDKPYIRPIVRGKEIKKVEFGAKVHKLQIDGISFIEHLSFDAFNEGTRFKDTIYLAQDYMKTQTRVVGADGIYATNLNRKYATGNKIKTDFRRKGKPSKHKQHFDQLRQAITKERATRLEGSFGTDKEHFLLNRIKARTEKTEILWIFFGIHTSNALKIGRRISQQIQMAA